MPYKCQQCQTLFDLTEDSYDSLLKEVKEGQGLAKAIVSCPNSCYSFIVGAEQTSEGYEMFTKEIDTLQDGVFYTSLSTFEVVVRISNTNEIGQQTKHDPLRLEFLTLDKNIVKQLDVVWQVTKAKLEDSTLLGRIRVDEEEGVLLMNNTRAGAYIFKGSYSVLKNLCNFYGVDYNALDRIILK